MQRNDFDQYNLSQSQQLNEEFIVKYHAYLENMKKLKHFQLIHQPSYSMKLDDYISIEFFKRLDKSGNKNEFLELFAMLAELSEFLPKDKNTLLYDPLNAIFKNTLSLANSFIQTKENISDSLVSLNTSIKRTLEFIKDPIPRKASELISAADTMANTIAPDGTLKRNIQIICLQTIAVSFIGGMVAVCMLPYIAYLLAFTALIFASPIKSIGLAIFDMKVNYLVFKTNNLNESQHKLSKPTLFQAVSALNNPQRILIANENQQAKLRALDELISTKKNQTKETVEKKIRQMREDYTAIESNINLLKQFQIKHYPADTNLTHYLSSETAFKIIQNDPNQEYFNEKTHQNIMTLMKSLSELSLSIERADPSIQTQMCVTLFNAIKLSEELIKHIDEQSANKISALNDVIKNANAFALDQDNSNHRSLLINSTNKMINKICSPVSIYPENRSRVSASLAAGVCALAVGICASIAIMTTGAALTPLIPLMMFASLVGVSTFGFSIACYIGLLDKEDKSDKTFAYNVGRQLDIISKPSSFFFKREIPIVSPVNVDDPILFSNLAHYQI